MTSGDAEEVKEMMRVFYASEAVMTNGSEEIFESDVKACLAEGVPLEGLIFDDGGKTAGYAMLAGGFSTEFGKPCLWVEDLYIKPEHRRKGIGRAFFEPRAYNPPRSRAGKPAGGEALRKLRF